MLNTEMSEALATHSARVVDQVTWPLFDKAIRALTRQVRDSSYEPDLILAVARGGLVPAAALAYSLGVKQIATVSVRYYIGQGRRLREPVLLPPLPAPDVFQRKRILVVDDVADTGATLCLVKNLCSGTAAAIRTAVLFEKPAALIRSEYVWRRTAAWLDFPWEVQAVGDAPHRWRDDG